MQLYVDFFPISPPKNGTKVVRSIPFHKQFIPQPKTIMLQINQYLWGFLYVEFNGGISFNPNLLRNEIQP